MKVLIAYASDQGQTRKISRFVGDRLIDAGHSVEILPAADGFDLDVSRFDAAVLAGSVHAGELQKSLRRFAADHSAALNTRPSVFLQVSLAVAGDDEEELAATHKIAEDFAQKTGWTPDRTEYVAGAYRFSEYNFLETWMMRWVARQKDPDLDGKSDKEYTDWAALQALIDDWTTEIAASST